MSALTTSALSHGLFIPSGGDSCNYPSVDDVRKDVDRGDGEVGTLELPSPRKVLLGTTYGANGRELGGLFQPAQECPQPRRVVYPPAPQVGLPPIDCVPPVVRKYYATRTYTAYCQDGVTSHTETRQVCSMVSAKHASDLAYQQAKEAAEAALNCPPPETVVYTSTKTASYTASCAEGYTGESKTAEAEATATSTESQAAADAAAQSQAEANAMAAATAMLECTLLPVYSSTKTATAYCQDGLEGAPYTATVTATSTLSQEDADNKAQLQAEQAAAAGLVCTLPVYTASATVTVACEDGSQSTASAEATSSVSYADAYENALSQADAIARSLCS